MISETCVFSLASSICKILSCLSENFSKYRLFIEEQIFPSVTWLGLDVDSIYEDYQLELIQSSGGSNKPSTGRLRYIKGHLTTLLKRVKEYNS